jgi:hypothetical protein
MSKQRVARVVVKQIADVDVPSHRSSAQRTYLPAEISRRLVSVKRVS